MAHPELRKLHDVVEKGNKEVVARNPREDRNTAKNAMQIDSSGEKEDKSAKGKEANKAGHSQTMEIETHEDTEGWQTVPKGRGRNRTNKSTNVFTDQQTSNNETMHMKDDQTKVTAMCEESTAKATIPKHKGTPANNGQLTLSRFTKTKFPMRKAKMTLDTTKSGRTKLIENIHTLESLIHHMKGRLKEGNTMRKTTVLKVAISPIIIQMTISI